MISLCMITRDEEQFLPRCLSSVQGMVDEIVVVDTGSSDATAAIASLVIWFVSSVFVTDTYVEQPQMIAVAMNQAQTVSLIFDSHTDIQLAKLRIDLPDNMELDGYPGRRELTWQTSLKKGQNILDLPIMAIGVGQGELLAQLNYDGTVKILRVVLKTIADDV